MSTLDRCIFNATSAGTGDFVVLSAVHGFQTPTAAGAADQIAYSYVAQSLDLTEWEVGYGVWFKAANTLIRGGSASAPVRSQCEVTSNSLGTTALINFTTPPQVMMTAITGNFAGTSKSLTRQDQVFYVRTKPTSVTISNGSPAVVSWAGHGLQVNDPVVFSMPMSIRLVTITTASPAVATVGAGWPTNWVAINHGYAVGDPVSFFWIGGEEGATGSLPTGLTSGTTYYVTNDANFTATTFAVSDTQAHALAGTNQINTTVPALAGSTNYVQRASTLPTGVTEGQIYYVISAGYGANSFEFSTAIGGAPVNTSSGQIGMVWAQTGNDSNDGTDQTRSTAWLTVQHGYNTLAQYAFGFDTPNNLHLVLAHGVYYDGGSNVIDLGRGPKPPASYPGRAFVIQGDTTGGTDNDNWQTGAIIRASGFAITFIANLDYYRNWQFAISQIMLDHTDTSEACFAGSPGFSNIVLDDITYRNGYEKIVIGGYDLTLSLIGEHVLIGDAGLCFINMHDGAGLQIAYGTSIWGVETLNVQNMFITGNYLLPTPTYIDNEGANFYGNFNGFAVNLGGPTYFQENLSTGGTISEETGIFGVASLANGSLGDSGQMPGPIYTRNMNLVRSKAIRVSPGVNVDNLYDYQSPLTGFSYTPDVFTGNLILDSSSTLASGTVVMPATPYDGHQISVRTTQIISSMTFSPNAGQVVLGAPTALAVGQQVTAIYRSTNATWYFGS